jgi:hypothetical protein
MPDEPVLNVIEGSGNYTVKKRGRLSLPLEYNDKMKCL